MVSELMGTDDEEIDEGASLIFNTGLIEGPVGRLVGVAASNDDNLAFFSCFALRMCSS